MVIQETARAKRPTAYLRLRRRSQFRESVGAPRPYSGKGGERTSTYEAPTKQVKEAIVRKLLPALLIAAVLIPAGVVSASSAPRDHGSLRKVKIPEADRFTPFALTIHVGDAVKWSNGDEDDHTVVSVDAFNTAGHKGTDHVIEVGGTFVLHFDRPGVFVYYCRFHAHLDAYNQPVAPGPDGGIEENGNFGTPMSGVITVIDDD
jgi:plastocyanin